MTTIFLLEVYDSCNDYVVSQHAFSSKDKACAKACEIEGVLALDWFDQSNYHDNGVHFSSLSRLHFDYYYNIHELTLD